MQNPAYEQPSSIIETSFGPISVTASSGWSERKTVEENFDYMKVRAFSYYFTLETEHPGSGNVWELKTSLNFRDIEKGVPGQSWTSRNGRINLEGRKLSDPGKRGNWSSLQKSQWKDFQARFEAEVIPLIIEWYRSEEALKLEVATREWLIERALRRAYDNVQSAIEQQRNGEARLAMLLEVKTQVQNTLTVEHYQKEETKE